MKLVGIGDLFIPKEHIQNGFSFFSKYDVEVETIQWELDGFNHLQNINLMVEKEGSNAYDVPQYIIDKIADADIIITQFCPINDKVLDACTKLKAIGVLRGGYENIALESISRKNIIVFNTPGRNSDSVADFTIGAIICECRNIAKGHYGLKNGKWIRIYPNSSYIPDLPGKTVGLIGLGEIGRKVAKRLSGFDVNILAYDPYVREAGETITLVSLEKLMRESDFVSIHARLTDETKHIINEKTLSLMKRTAYLINTSRAGLVDESVLYSFLAEKKIAGAMLDVFETEPPGVNYPLVTLDNITITPHMAGGSTDAFLNSPKRQADEMCKLWKKEESPYIINKNIFRELIKSEDYPF